MKIDLGPNGYREESMKSRWARAKYYGSDSIVKYMNTGCKNVFCQISQLDSQGFRSED